MTRLILAAIFATTLLAGGAFAGEPPAEPASHMTAAASPNPATPPAAAPSAPAQPLKAPPAAAARKPLAKPDAAKAYVIPRSGKDLVDQIQACRDDLGPQQATEFEVCHGLQAGVVGGISVYTQLIGLPRPFCLPPTATDADIDDAVIVFVSRHLKARNWGSTSVIVGAMIERFPCPKPAPAKPAKKAPAKPPAAPGHAAPAPAAAPAKVPAK